MGSQCVRLGLIPPSWTSFHLLITCLWSCKASHIHQKQDCRPYHSKGHRWAPHALTLEPQPRQWGAPSPTGTRSGWAMASVSSPAVSSNWRNSMASTITSTGTFTRYSNQSIRSVATFTTLVSAFSTSSSNNWWKHTGPVFPPSLSLASSLCSSNGSQISHDSGLPQLPPSNNKLTCFSAYMPLMHLLTGQSYSDDWCSKGTGRVLFGSVSLHSAHSPIFVEVHRLIDSPFLMLWHPISLS